MAKNLFDLTGKVALVTGANSGLGLGYATGLAKAGADVVIWGRSAEKNAAAVKTLKVHGGRVEAQLVDVSSEGEVVRGIEAALSSMGRLDCVIANAGFTTMAPFHTMTGETYHQLLATNQHGAFYTLREAAKHMIARAQGGDPGGSLIICGSLSIFAGSATLSHYGAAKGALNSMSKAMAVELGPHGIRVNVIAPGFIITEMIRAKMDLAAPLIEMVKAKAPLKRPGDPADFEGVAVYLASDASKYHTGDTLVIDGGQSASVW
jgi:NAD(P)-dependent dehydrogenase (short-subunit alcohol dehydrogenase family)